MHTSKVRCRAIIIDTDELLLVKHSGGRDFFALPGGHLDFGEDPRECMEREIIEELGIKPDIGRLLYVYSFVNDAGEQSIEFFFEIKNGSDYRTCREQERSHAFEIEEIVWIKRNTELPIRPELFKKEWNEGRVLSDETRFLKN